MNRLISYRFALQLLGTLLVALLLFHIFILLDIVPRGIIWGGRISSGTELYMKESIAIVILLLMLSILLFRAGLIRYSISPKIISSGLWFMFGFFCLNTLGNLLSGQWLEKVIFTPLTLTSACLVLRIIKGTEAEKQKLSSGKTNME